MDHDLRLYDQLLSFPFFQGLNRTELLQMAGNTKFGFLKLPAGKTLLHEGDPCQQLSFLVSGTLSITTSSHDHSYSMAEQLKAPWMLEPEALFGAQPRHSVTAKALTDVHLITLSKDEVMRLLDDFLVLRLNLLNLYATLAQRRAAMAWRRCPKPLTDRIVRFLLDHSVYPAGPKKAYILRQRLADEVNASRRDVSQVLNDLQQHGLVVLHRGCIEVPLLEHLFM